MHKMSCAGEDHRQIMFVRGLDNFGIFDRTAGLNYCRDAEFSGFVNVVAERKKSI